MFASSLLLAAFAAACSPIDKPQACWLETSAGDMDAALGGAGLRETKVWHSTISTVLIRHPKGDVLIDTGFSPDAEAQMNELPPAGQDLHTVDQQFDGEALSLWQSCQAPSITQFANAW